MSTSHDSLAVDAKAPGIDLRQLAMPREFSEPRAIRVRRRWLARYILPLGIVIAFLAMFFWAARENFLPARSVTITPVIVTRAEVQQEGTPLFQAAGWVEPRPTPISVSSFVPGIVEELYVVEGQLVPRGEPIAKLIDVDAKLSLEQAQAALRLQEADVRSAKAALTSAQTTLANPTELQAALAEAESSLEETKLTLGSLPYSVEAAMNHRQLCTDNVDRKEQAGSAIAGRVLREARAELAAAENALAQLQARKPTLEAQVSALERKRFAISKQLSLMTAQKQAVALAEAALIAAEARRDQARLSIDSARLTLDRMLVRAPIAGRILTLDARPGVRLAGMDPVAQHSGAIAAMYDPKSLQIRVDVRLEDVPNVRVGQPVQIATAVLAKPIVGEVLSVTTQADIQKNTLQVKVAISDPPSAITPEMLAQVTFVSPRQPKEATATTNQPLRLLVPRQTIHGEDGSTVWLADCERGVARQQRVELGSAATDELVEIVKGLDPTAKLITGGAEGLVDGTRIRILGEDQSMNATIGTSFPRNRSAQSATRR